MLHESWNIICEERSLCITFSRSKMFCYLTIPVPDSTNPLQKFRNWSRRRRSSPPRRILRWRNPRRRGSRAWSWRRRRVRRRTAPPTPPAPSPIRGPSRSPPPRGRCGRRRRRDLDFSRCLLPLLLWLLSSMRSSSRCCCRLCCSGALKKGIR